MSGNERGGRRVSRPHGRIRIGLLSGAALMLCFALPAPAVHAQERAERTAAREIIYQREVYQYGRGDRPDPFRSPLVNADMGIRSSDLALRGIVYNSDPRQSVAVLVEKATDRRIRARVGERIGGLRVVAIHPRRVDLVVEELGVARRESLFLKAEPETGTQQ